MSSLAKGMREILHRKAFLYFSANWERKLTNLESLVELQSAKTC